MRWLCIFRQCNWIWYFNAKAHEFNPAPYETVGVYQCTRCKTISIGAPR
jgi:hypothetical protein